MPANAALLAIACDALLDHLTRGDPRHSLGLLLSALGLALGQPCSLQSLGADGQPGWAEGPPPPTDATALAIDRLGVRLGLLRVGGAPDAAALRQRLAPLLPALQGLLHQAVLAGMPAADSAHMGLIRAALAGAGTFVWEWSIDNDWLSDIDEGLAQLGYALGPVGHTQEDWNRLIHPDDREANHQAYLRHERGEVDVYEHAYRALAADGSWRWMVERGRIVERHADGRASRMVGTQADITDRRAKDQAAREATERLARIARQVPGMLFQFDRNAGEVGHFSYMSERAPDLFGAPREALRIQNEAFWLTIERADRYRLAATLDESERTLGEWRCDFRVTRGDGAQRWMLALAMPERLAEGRTAWYGYVQDITERRELDSALHAAALADAANRAKTEFLSRMSHELRTPLNAVLGFAQLMEIDNTEPPTAGQQRRLTLIRGAGAHLLRMIDDMLDLTRIEAGGLALQIEPVPLGALARQALDMVREIAERAQVTLHLVAADETTVLADRTRLLQILFNLLGNAIKYNRPGGTVALSLERAANGEVQMRVRDSGLGISEADLPHVFEPFQRGNQAGGRVEGTGIGLAVTRSLVQLMGGSINARSEPGAGSEFSVRLPLDAVPVAALYDRDGAEPDRYSST
jgi:PAS domain S-box-containing protein